MSVHRLGLLTAGLGILLILSFLQLSPLAAPLAVAFVGVAFWWNLSRPDPALRQHGPAGRCTGCAEGCAGCRERIDVGEVA